MPRSFFDFFLLQQIRAASLATINSGRYAVDFRKRYSCGQVSFAVMKYIATGDQKCLKVKYELKPLSFDHAYERCQLEFGRKMIKIENSSLGMIKFRLLGLGSGSYAMVSAEFDKTKPTGKFMGGLMNKFWGHWFILMVIGDKIYPVDAYSSLTFHSASFTDEYLSQYKNDGVDAIIYPVNKRMAMHYLN